MTKKVTELESAQCDVYRACLDFYEEQILQRNIRKEYETIKFETEMDVAPQLNFKFKISVLPEKWLAEMIVGNTTSELSPENVESPEHYEMSLKYISQLLVSKGANDDAEEVLKKEVDGNYGKVFKGDWTEASAVSFGTWVIPDGPILDAFVPRDTTPNE